MWQGRNSDEWLHSRFGRLRVPVLTLCRLCSSVVCPLSPQVAFLNAMHHPCIVAIREYFEHDSGVRHSNGTARTHAQSGSIRSGPSHTGAVTVAVAS